MTGIRAKRAAAVISLADSGVQDAIRFIETGNDVHVLTVPGYVPDRYRELFGDGDEEHQMRSLVGEVWSICGVRIVRNRGGFEAGGQLVSHFPDEKLCDRCFRAFGDRSVLIFEANQDDGRDPTIIGRLANDFITRGQML